MDGEPLRATKPPCKWWEIKQAPRALSRNRQARSRSFNLTEVRRSRSVGPGRSPVPVAQRACRSPPSKHHPSQEEVDHDLAAISRAIRGSPAQDTVAPDRARARARATARGNGGPQRAKTKTSATRPRQPQDHVPPLAQPSRGVTARTKRVDLEPTTQSIDPSYYTIIYSIDAFANPRETSAVASPSLVLAPSQTPTLRAAYPSGNDAALEPPPDAMMRLISVGFQRREIVIGLLASLAPAPGVVVVVVVGHLPERRLRPALGQPTVLRVQHLLSRLARHITLQDVAVERDEPVSPLELVHHQLGCVSVAADVQAGGERLGAVELAACRS